MLNPLYSTIYFSLYIQLPPLYFYLYIFSFSLVIFSTQLSLSHAFPSFLLQTLLLLHAFFFLILKPILGSFPELTLNDNNFIDIYTLLLKANSVVANYSDQFSCL